MIDWNKTGERFGYFSVDTSPYRPRIIVICDKCGAEGCKQLRNKTDDGQWECKKCIANKSSTIEKLRTASKKLWEDDAYKQKNLNAVRSDQNKQKLRENWYKFASKIVQSDDYKKKMSETIKKVWQDDEFRQKITESSTKMWEDENLSKQMLASRRTETYRENQKQKALQRWKDPQYVEKQNSSRARATRSKEHLAEIRLNQRKVSSLQTILYSILDDLNVAHYREFNDRPDDKQCKIGPYSFDCVIPREGRSTLLIECQGEYWHSVRSSSDLAKASYINNNFPLQYEIKYLWEHEFLNRNKVADLLKYWLGTYQFDLIDFNFSDAIIKQADPRDYKLLLSKYHYLTNAGRGGISFGAYLNDKLVAVCIFSPLLRQNIDLNGQSTRELSRLCIHPCYQKKNFASWFISRCIKMLDKRYKTIIAYSDTTFNHLGSVYKACNFRQDKVVRPDYWYVSNDGWVMHKKTLYNHAVKMKMKEAEYAKDHEYRKVFGKEKLRFIIIR